MRRVLLAAGILLTIATAQAQEADTEPTSGWDMERITPLDGAQPAPDILTTKKAQAQKSLQGSPFDKAASPTSARPPAKPAENSVPAAPAKKPSVSKYEPGYVPFGKATPMTGPRIPEGPHTATAMPIDDIDSGDVSTPAVEAVIPPEEDPAAEDPEKPTEFSSPIFDEKDNPHGPHKITFRALNKVTAKSTLFAAQAGATVTFGQLEIVPVSCRISSPNSLQDFAGLFDIHEKLTGKDEGKKKQLFSGWMYASSPSISSLENPVYDVAMVSCDVSIPAPKADDKPAKKSGKKAKK